MTNATKLFIAAAVVIVLALFVLMRPSAEVPVVRHLDPSSAPASADVATLSGDVPSAQTHAVRRNLFAYEEPPRHQEAERFAARHVEPAAVVVQSVTPPRAVEKQIERPPDFNYRYIGRFGPETNPIAAFARDGEVVDARPGDVIAGRFILHSIGLESVEIAYVGMSGELRVPIASSAR
jgi:hypothetical protein